MQVLVLCPIPLSQQHAIAAIRGEIDAVTGVPLLSSVPPHITLYPPIDSLDAGLVTRIVSSATLGMGKIPVTLDRLRAFDQGYVVLLADAPELLPLRDALYRRISRQPGYRHVPGDRDFTPHVTLAELPAEALKTAWPQIQSLDFALQLPRRPLAFKLETIEVWHRELAREPWVLRKRIVLRY